MPHVGSNIPQNNFYSEIEGEFFRIFPLTVCLRDFLPMAKELLERLKQQSFTRGTTSTSLRKIFLIKRLHQNPSSYGCSYG